MESLDQECRDRCDGDGNGATDAALRRRAVIGARAPHAGLALEATPITPTLTLSNPRPARATPRTPPRGHETNPVLHLYARLAPNEPAGPGQRSPRPWRVSSTPTQRAPQHWNRISLKLQRCDVRISTPEDDGKGLVVDYSTTCCLVVDYSITCSTLHFESKQSTTQPATDFRENPVSPLDIPLHAAPCQREKEKLP